MIKSIYPDSITHTKTLDIEFIDNRHHYLILNYELFQQAKSENKLKKFIVSNNINFIVIDEKFVCIRIRHGVFLVNWKIKRATCNEVFHLSGKISIEN